MVGHLGPDLLGPDWDPALAVRLLSRDPDKAIGEALLDQRNLAGIGNVYAAELLFLRGINPWTRVDAVDDVQLRGLFEDAARWLKSNVGQTAALVAESGTTLTSLYGIGPLTAGRILAEVGDITRFVYRALGPA